MNFNVLFLIQAITGGVCSLPPNPIIRGIEIKTCAGTETKLNDCSSWEGTCREWAGIISIT